MKKILGAFFLLLAATAPAMAEDVSGGGDFIGDDGNSGRGNGGFGDDDDRGGGRGRDDDGFGNGPDGNPGLGGDPVNPGPGPTDPFGGGGGGGFEPQLPPVFEPPTPTPSPITPSPTPGPVDPGPSFPAPTPMPNPVFESPVMNPAPINSGVMPSTVNQARRDPTVSVYSQSSSSAWVEGDPYSVAGAGAVPESSPQAMLRSAPDSSFVWVVSGEVVSKNGTSVTIRDRRRKQTTIFAEPGVVGSLRKGSMIQATMVPGSNRAKSLQKLS